ncbi:bifunctional 2-polyprenyl-6-hydroxyphenol methylase/3-demethylubiquinol 3-O-methyltransferase UbiG [Erythrobacter sp. CCH5-A1]|jgi:SAM-dependent methyltransferase|uniref:class I SAM-dependent methyltransferase n=1 Tax=Erythrobacter sp. CCH5-A1 TaxID=1768792 RepID=UPI0008358BEC|nr:class I SAM-dependent methyltransferase [Erythrobacter sp. CCH5-A1]
MQSHVFPDCHPDEDQNEDIEICSHCLYCGSAESFDATLLVRDEFFGADSGTFEIQRCASCESLWLKNRPVGSRLLSAYANYYTHTPEDADGGAVSRARTWIKSSYLRSQLVRPAGLIDRLVARAVALVGYDTSGLDKSMRFVPAPPATILDYGCGNGHFLLRLQALDYELHGAEYDPHLLGKLSQAGIAIHDVATLTDDRWDRAFDHITLSHVLEHVPDPIALLHRLKGWLKPGGGLYIDLPNADATGLTIFGPYWRGLEAPRHFSLPTRNALVRAVESAGLVVERQHIDQAARPWLWDQSLKVIAEDARPAFLQAMSDAPPETETNAEQLTFLVRRPA